MTLSQNNEYEEERTKFSFRTAQSEAHLAQGAFKLPEEIVITQVMRVIVNIIDRKFHLLHHLKIVVENKLLGKLWVQVVQDHLCAPDLTHGKNKYKQNI